MKKKVCNDPSCNTLIEPGERYCERHKRDNAKARGDRIPFQNAQRYNAEFYRTSTWRNLRKQVLRENPFCEKCGIPQKETSLHVHHKIPPRGDEGLFYDIDNLAVLCEGCHRGTTAREIAGRR